MDEEATLAPSSPSGIQWREARDPNSGRKYWYHTNTKATTWVNPIPGAVRDLAVSEFQKFDSDGGGTISSEELNDALRDMGIVLKEDQVKVLVGRYDEDASGELDVDE